MALQHSRRGETGENGERVTVLVYTDHTIIAIKKQKNVDILNQYLNFKISGAKFNYEKQKEFGLEGAPHHHQLPYKKKHKKIIALGVKINYNYSKILIIKTSF